MASISINQRNRGQLREFLYNLALIAPGKGEAKSSISGSNIFVQRVDHTLYGWATDDIISVRQTLNLPDDPAYSEVIGIITTDQAKAFRNELTQLSEKDKFLFSVDSVYDYNFWWDHVNASINGSVKGRLLDPTLALSPDRLRKFGLLEPRGKYPLDLERVQWNHNDIVRWKYGPDTNGVLAPLDRDILRKQYGSEILWGDEWKEN